MDIRKVKKLIELLEESGIAEIEIKEGEESIRISRMPTGAAPVQFPQYAPAPSLPLPALTVAPAAAAAARDYTVAAPMVGTFYSAPVPGAKAFAQIGDEVKVGQVLCIIEAMKMMNQIESDRAGRISAVLAQNGDPVEFGQALFAIQ